MNQPKRGQSSDSSTERAERAMTQCLNFIGIDRFSETIADPKCNAIVAAELQAAVDETLERVADLSDGEADLAEDMMHLAMRDAFESLSKKIRALKSSERKEAD